jgi:hypothetical protein
MCFMASGCVMVCVILSGAKEPKLTTPPSPPAPHA